MWATEGWCVLRQSAATSMVQTAALARSLEGFERTLACGATLLPAARSGVLSERVKCGLVLDSCSDGRSLGLWSWLPRILRLRSVQRYSQYVALRPFGRAGPAWATAHLLHC